MLLCYGRLSKLIQYILPQINNKYALTKKQQKNCFKAFCNVHFKNSTHISMYKKTQQQKEKNSLGIIMFKNLCVTKTRKQNKENLQNDRKVL